MHDNFFGSKLNTVLLIILIILMAVAIKIMLQTKELYLHPLTPHQTMQSDSSTTPQLLGDKDDLAVFSVTPGQKVSGTLKIVGAARNTYFFEGNIVINILDANKKIMKAGHGTATTDWMKPGAVAFEATIDFSNLPKGTAFIDIHNDNPSGLATNDKSILVPVVIE